MEANSARHLRKPYVTNACGSILVALLALLSLFPFYWLLKSSLMSNEELFLFPPKYWPDEFLWSNYMEVFKEVPIMAYFKNTMLIIVPLIIGTLVTSSLCGYGFARLEFPLKKLWFALVISTMMLPAAASIIPKYIMWSELNAVNTYVPLILPAWFGGGAFNIFLIRQFFLGISKELDESAIIDGAGYFKIFYHIMLPLIVPVLVVITFFTFVREWNDFFEPLIYLNDSEKYTLALGLLSLRGEYNTQWNILMAASTIMTVPAIVIFFAGQRYFVEGITFTGIKG